MWARVTIIIGILLTLIIGCVTPVVNAPGKKSRVTTDFHPPIVAKPLVQKPDIDQQTEVQTQLHAEPTYTNLWDRIRAGFKLPPLENKYISQYQRWHQLHPEYLVRLVERARPYLFHIVEEVERRGMPMEIALLPAIESAFKPTAYSRANASGLWQFIPATGRRYGLKQNWWYDGRRDVVHATNAALDYLEFLHKEFDHDWFHALAAYNAGEHRIRRAIKSNLKRNKPTHYSDLQLKTETRRYVPKLIALKRFIKNTNELGLRLPSIPNQPYFAAVDVDSQIDLNIVSKLADLPNDEIRRLNPGFKRWATDPDGPHILLVPLANEDRLLAGVRALPASERLRWERYQIRSGDTLSTIAQRYGLSVSALQTSNRLKSNLIRAGRTLLIPVSSAKQPSYTDNIVSVSSKNTNSEQPTLHRVRNGDTLWAIAKRYKVYVKQLARWNAIATNDLLHLGQKIVVYQN